MILIPRMLVSAVHDQWIKILRFAVLGSVVMKTVEQWYSKITFCEVGNQMIKTCSNSCRSIFKSGIALAAIWLDKLLVIEKLC